MIRFDTMPVRLSQLATSPDIKHSSWFINLMVLKKKKKEKSKNVLKQISFIGLKTMASFFLDIVCDKFDWN